MARTPLRKWNACCQHKRKWAKTWRSSRRAGGLSLYQETSLTHWISIRHTSFLVSHAPLYGRTGKKITMVVLNFQTHGWLLPGEGKTNIFLFFCFCFWISSLHFPRSRSLILSKCLTVTCFSLGHIVHKRNHTGALDSRDGKYLGLGGGYF